MSHNNILCSPPHSYFKDWTVPDDDIILNKPLVVPYYKCLQYNIVCDGTTIKVLVLIVPI